MLVHAFTCILPNLSLLWKLGSRLKMEKSILMCMSGCIKIFIVLLFGTIPSGELSETLEILAFEATIWDIPP